MKFIKDIEPEEANQYTIGNKAANLYRLKKIGLSIPKWVVISHEELSINSNQLLPGNYSNPIEAIANASIPASIVEEIKKYFPGCSFFAVRSSAIGEDTMDFSFAGQYESFLYVTINDLASAIKKVWSSAFSDRVFQYRKINNINDPIKIAIIIQEMVDAESAGVAFGIHPSSGDRNAKVISSVYGVGEGLVSGQLDSDNFIVKDGTITSQLANKKHKIIIGSESLGGTKTVSVDENKSSLPSISNKNILQIANILDSYFNFIASS